MSSNSFENKVTYKLFALKSHTHTHTYFGIKLASRVDMLLNQIT